MTEDRVAMPRNTAPVPAKAVITRLAPLARPSTVPTSRDSIRPMKKVKASRTGTPAAEFLVFSIANMKPKAPAKEHDHADARRHGAGEAGRDAEPRTQNGGHHRQREQPVGVAQHLVALNGRGFDRLQRAEYADVLVHGVS